MKRLSIRRRVAAVGLALAAALGATPLATAGPAQAQTGPTACIATTSGSSASGSCINPHPDIYFYVVVYCNGSTGTWPRYSPTVSSFHTTWVSCSFPEQAAWAAAYIVVLPPPAPEPTPTPTPTPAPTTPPWEPPCPECQIP